MAKRNWKHSIVHELNEYLLVFLFVAPFFVSFTTYRMYLVGDWGNWLFTYGASLVSALILSKVILIGEIAGLGKRSENMSLIVSTIYKAALFTVFYQLFHILEGTVRGLVHHRTLRGALSAATVVEKGEFASLALVVFFAFIPFFALRETRRVLGVGEFHDLFFDRRRSPR